MAKQHLLYLHYIYIYILLLSKILLVACSDEPSGIHLTKNAGVVFDTAGTHDNRNACVAKESEVPTCRK